MSKLSCTIKACKSITIILACSLVGYAQTHRQAHCELVFAPTGQILNEPPNHLWEGGTLTFRVGHSVGAAAVSPQLLLLTDQLVAAYFLLGSEDDITHQLQQAGFGTSSLPMVRQQYAATIRNLLVEYPLLNRYLPQLKQVNWTVASVGVNSEPTTISVAAGISPLFAPTLLLDTYRLYLHAPYSATPRHFKAASFTTDTCILKLHHKGPLRFEIRRPTLDSILLSSPALQMPSELQNASFTSELGALSYYKPLLEKASGFLNDNTPLDAATLTDIQKGIVRLKAEIQRANMAGYRTEATARWLLQQLWRAPNGRLTATPAYKVQEDEWLYQGSLEVSPKSATYPSWQPWPLLSRGLVTMRNHDAAQLYKMTNIGNEVALAINEQQQMAILLYNLSKKNQPSTSVTPTSNKPDDLVSEAMGEIELMSAKALPLRPLSILNVDSLQDSPPVLGARPSVGTAESKQLVELYTQLAGYMKPFVNWQNRVLEPGARDTLPEFRTMEVPFQQPTEVPALVKYTITDALYPDKAVPGLPGFSYQQNRLYRFRVKAGIVYSGLDRRSYSVDKTTNTATRTTEKVGLAAAVGLQLFVPRIDIQEKRLVSRPFLYAGYLLSGRVVDNLLLGVGVEPIPGLSLLGGFHLSTANDRLIQTNGLLSVKKDGFQSGGFLQLALGLTAFNALFKTSTLSNPFASR